MRVSIIGLLLALFCCHGHAEIYQCLHQNHHIEFRDKPCEANSIEQGVRAVDPKIRVNSLETHASQFNSDLADKHKKADRKKTIAERKKIVLAEKAERKALRLKKRQEKLERKAAQKEERQMKKQKKLSEKIQKIENQLRLGTKLKNQKQLHLEVEKICQNPS